MGLSSAVEQKRICETLLSIDPGIIYTCILSMDGEEISNAAKPSAKVMMPSEEELSRHFKSISRVLSIYSSQKEALPEGERHFGKLKQIVAIFSNYKVLVVLSSSKQVMAALIALKDADSHRISFQVSRVIS